MLSKKMSIFLLFASLIIATVFTTGCGTEPDEDVPVLPEEDKKDYEITPDMSGTEITENVKIKVLEAEWEKFDSQENYLLPFDRGNISVHGNSMVFLAEDKAEKDLVVNLVDLETGEVNELARTYYEAKEETNWMDGIDSDSWWNFQWMEEELLMYSHNDILLYDLEKSEVMAHRKFQAIDSDLDPLYGERPIYGITYSANKESFAVILDKNAGEFETQMSVAEDEAILTLLDRDLNIKDYVVSVIKPGRREGFFYYHNMNFIDNKKIVLSEEYHPELSDSKNVFLIDLEDKTINKVITVEGFGKIKSINPSPDGKMIYAWQRNAEDSWRKIYDYQGNEKAEFDLEVGPNDSAWSPDGSMLALSDKVWHRDQGVLAEIDLNLVTEDGFHWSADSRRLFDGKKLWHYDEGLVKEVNIGDKRVLGWDENNRIWLTNSF
ncbi:hypothetical protein [Dethiobacter alkaliphilus]|uniref:hypothetical protein n=1 Tax=Dethiobacter alkaliphilus TaxID=427926 RepID=UPI002226B654|nr:hypothetical protein [Dethiobacter alkaliphilus]MCW3491056.1 hypothetical protein [Dethiobacter alkaliphilus]